MSDLNKRHKAALDVALLDLDVAAIPTKSDVFVRCGPAARDLHDAITDLRARLQAAEERAAKMRDAKTHLGDPCVYCGTAHDDVAPGPCGGEDIRVSKAVAERVLRALDPEMKHGWPTPLWCDVQAFKAHLRQLLALKTEGA